MIKRITAVRLYFLPVQTRVPLKFGHETLTSVTCARVCLRVADESGNEAEGWGETPLSVQWVWPSPLPYQQRHETLIRFCHQLAYAWAYLDRSGHPLELGCYFQEDVLAPTLAKFNQAHNLSRTENSAAIPHLAALVCSSPFDIALHDAFGQLVRRPVYETYGPEFLSSDLSSFLEPAPNSRLSF